jgi:hypothetical protein
MEVFAIIFRLNLILIWKGQTFVTCVSLDLEKYRARLLITIGFSPSGFKHLGSKGKRLRRSSQCPVLSPRGRNPILSLILVCPAIPYECELVG